MSDEAINRVAEITALPPAVAADLLVRTGGDPERVIQLYFDYEGDVPAVNAALMAGSANASVLDMLEAANDNPFLDDQSGVDDPFDSLISAAVGTDDDATASVPLFDDADLFAPTFGNSSANSNAALSSGPTFGSMSGRNNSAQNSNRSGSAGLFGDQLGTGGAVDTSAQPPSDALFDLTPMEEAQMAPVPANAANPFGDYDDHGALFGEAGLVEEEEEEGEGDDAPLFSDFSDDDHNNNDYFSEESDGPSGDAPDWRRDDLRGGVAQAVAPPVAGSAEDRLLIRLRQIDEALGEAMSRLAMVDGPSAGQARAAVARAQTIQRRAVDDAMAVAREQRAREAAVDEALSLATAHARDVVHREGESLAASLRVHVDAEVLSWVRGTADSVAARMLLGRHTATVDREAGLAAREARLQALQGDLEAAAGTVAQSAHYTRSRVIQELIAARPVIEARRHAYYGRGRELVSFGQRDADGRHFDDDDDDADDDDEVTAGSAPPDYSDLGYGRRYGATPPPGSPTAPPVGGGGWQAGRPAPRRGNRSGGYMQQQPQQQQQQQQQIRGFRSDEALARLGGSDDEDATVASPFAVTPAAAEHRRPAPIEAAGANGDYDLTIPSPTVQGILRENLIGMNASDVTVSIPGPSAANDVNVVGQRTYTFVIPSTLATFSNDEYVREDVIAETPSGVISRAEAHHSLWAVTDVRLPINEDFVGAFMAEATVHSDMTHPGLVLFHGVIAEPDAGRLALVREFQAGGTLAERLRPGHAAYVGGNALTDRLLMCFQICRCIQKVHQRGFVDGRITAERVMFERPDGLQPVHLLLSFMSRIAPAAYEPIEDKRLEAFDSNPPLALEPDGVDVSRDIAMFAIVCIDTILGAHGSDPSDLGVVDGLDPDLATALQDAVSTRWADIRPLCRALRDASR